MFSLTLDKITVVPVVWLVHCLCQWFCNQKEQDTADEYSVQNIWGRVLHVIFNIPLDILMSLATQKQKLQTKQNKNQLPQENI